MLKEKKETKKVAITFRIASETYERLKAVKQLSRSKGYIFTLQGELEKFIDRHIKEAKDKLKEIDS